LTINEHSLMYPTDRGNDQTVERGAKRSESIVRVLIGTESTQIVEVETRISLVQERGAHNLEIVVWEKPFR
jgi:hypothetical protein